MTSSNGFPMLGVHALHALAYCERLFYLENVENVRIADAAVFAGRRLHVEIERDEEGEWQTMTLESERLGLRGKVDCLRRRDGAFIPYEHKRGRAARLSFKDEKSGYTTWASDRVQVVAYALLIEEATGQTINEARVRYHQDNVTVRVAVDEVARADVWKALDRARQLSSSLARPPVALNEKLCVKCSLAPACLPEESRRAAELVTLRSGFAKTDDESSILVPKDRQTDSPAEVALISENQSKSIDSCSSNRTDTSDTLETPAAWSATVTTRNVKARSTTDGSTMDPLADEQGLASGTQQPAERPQSRRLFPADDKRQALHVLTQGARVGRSGDQFEISAPDEPRNRYPFHEVGQVVLHGFAQITTQALRLCSERDIGVHWMTQGGGYLGSFSAGAGCVHKRIRQYEALRDGDFRLALTRRLAEAKILSQLRFLLRASRDRDRESLGVRDSIDGIRRMMPALKRAASADEIRGVEGRVGALYFAALPALIDEGIDERFRPDGRSRRPPRDRFNAMLGFGYALLLKDVISAILTVGLEPAFGFFHTPRSQAQPLALDLIELFRVALVDLPLVASVNRRQWDAAADFSVTPQQVWLSDGGRKKMIELYERRKGDVWKHPVLGYSLSYARLIELEVRLLEKEWSGEPGLFARMRLR